MKNDKYIEMKSSEYALKLIELFKKRYIQELYQFVHFLLSEKEIKKLNTLISKGLNETLIISNDLKVNLKRRRSSRDLIISKKFDEDAILEIRSKLESSVVDDHEWTKIVEKLYLNNKFIYNEFIDKLVFILSKKKSINFSKSIFHKNLESLKKIFSLDAKEIEIITFLYLKESDYEIESIFSYKLIQMDNIIKSVRTYCRFFDVTPQEIRNYLSKDSKLKRSGLIGKDSSRLILSDYILSYLAGISRMDLLENFFTKKIVTNALDMNEHIVSKHNVKSMMSLLKGKSGCNILLYGKPGTGKTEFSKSIAKELEYPIYFINQYDEDGEENLSHRKSAIVAALNILDEKSIVVVDECDPIVSTKQSLFFLEDSKSKKDSKAWINGLLENSKHKIIWITNRIDSIDVSTRRRFSFSQEFMDFTKVQRQKVWEVVTDKYKIDYINSYEISELAAKYRVNAGGIALAVQDIKAMKSVKNKVDKKTMLENILSQHQKFVFGNQNTLIDKSSSYDSSILNVNISVDIILKRLNNFQKYTLDNPIDLEVRNLNILFYGPPGTGKTELVKHLAQNLGVEVNIKRLSDIRSKWYGESLKNIASMFEEAQESNNILFLDEADSFFVDRANSSNEYHLEETNEILTQMENFKGILICSTNMLESMDQAVLRRFTMKVSFDYLTNEGKISLFNSYFIKKSRKKLNIDQIEKIASLKHLTPGDFKVVKNKYFFEEDVSNDVLINDLSLEVALKRENRSKIGF